MLCVPEEDEGCLGKILVFECFHHIHVVPFLPPELLWIVYRSEESMVIH